MTNRFTDDAIDPRTASESVSAVEMLHVLKRNLAGGGGRGDRRVGQCASLAQGEDSRRQADFSHRNADKIFGIPRQAQEADAVLDAPRLGGNLYGIDLAVTCGVHGPRQIRRALKVVYGEQDTRRDGIFPNGLAGKLAQGFHFEVAPLATGFASLNQPVEFAVNVPGKFASALAATAGGKK